MAGEKKAYMEIAGVERLGDDSLRVLGRAVFVLEER